MRTRTLLLALTAVAALAVPAHAETTQTLGPPTGFATYNDGATGYVWVSWNNRPESARCAYRKTDTEYAYSGIALAAPFVAGTEVVRPVSVGIECAIYIGLGESRSLNASPGVMSAVGTVTGPASGPVTLCVRPTVHWSDNVATLTSGYYCTPAV
jgi:hypothetical protein